MKNLIKYVDGLNAYAAIFGSPKITFPLTASAVEELKDKLDCDLSPENLTCDGELSGAKVVAKAKYLKAVLADLNGCVPVSLLSKEPPPAPVVSQPPKDADSPTKIVLGPVKSPYGYVIYEPNTTSSPFSKYGSVQVFATLGVAKAMRTQYFKKNPDFTEDLAIAPVDEFFKLQKTKTVKNLMSGKEVEIPVNTPLCLDPSSETYWSM